MSDHIVSYWTQFRWDNKSNMKVYSWNIGKILAKINIKEHILPIFLINVINILAKTTVYKEAKNKHILKTTCPISIKQKLYWSVY